MSASGSDHPELRLGHRPGHWPARPASRLRGRRALGARTAFGHVSSVASSHACGTRAYCAGLIGPRQAARGRGESIIGRPIVAADRSLVEAEMPIATRESGVRCASPRILRP